MGRGTSLELAVDHPEVVRDRYLARDVVLLEPNMGRRRREYVEGLARRETLKLGDVVLDDETAAGLQVCGDGPEALDLFILGGQVRDRVAQEVGECERSVHLGGREIANGHLDVRRTLRL